MQADPEAAAARGLSLEDIRAAVSRANSSTPVGTLNGPKQDVALVRPRARWTRPPTTATSSSPGVTAHRCKLDEVAHIYDSVENDKIATWLNGRRAIVLAIYKQPDANTVAVVDGVRAKLPSLRAQIPPSVVIEVALDRSVSIRQSVSDVEETLLIAVSGDPGDLPVPALGVGDLHSGTRGSDFALGTFAVMYVLDFSINNMTLLALTLSVGFVVDDAIVMLENIVRHIEHGMRPYEAALKGAREIGFTIISITFSLIAVFIPVLLMGGIVGRVFREFAVTIAVAIVVSGFVSLTLTPMLCARVLKAHDESKKPNIVLRVFERMFDSWLRAYEWALDWVLARKAMMLVVTLATLAGTVALYIVVPKGFFPQEDTGFLFGTTEAATDSSFEAMKERQQALVAILRTDPAVDYINSTVGAGGPNATTNNGRLFVALKDRKGRDAAPVVIARLRQKATQVPGMLAFFQSVQNLNIGGRPSKSQYQYTLQSGDTESLYRLAPEMRDKIAQGPGAARRHHRSLHQESADDRRYRPRESRGLWHHRRSGT